MKAIDTNGGWRVVSGPEDLMPGEVLWTEALPVDAGGMALVVVEAGAARAMTGAEVLARLKTEALRRLAARRYEEEQAGVVVTVGAGEYRFDTARENRANWLTMLLTAQANPSFVQPDFKTNTGEFVALTAADVAAIVPAGFARVSACFTRERELADLVVAAADAAALAELEPLILAFWPEE